MSGLRSLKWERVRKRITVLAYVVLAFTIGAIFGLNYLSDFDADKAGTLLLSISAGALGAFLAAQIEPGKSRRNALRKMRFFSSVFECDPHIVLLLDENFNVTDCNPATLEFMGSCDKQSLLEGLSARLKSGIPMRMPDGVSGVSSLDMLKKASSDGTARFDTVFRVKERDFTLSVVFKRISLENESAIAGYIVDVSDLYRMRDDLGYRDRLLNVVNRAALILLSSGDAGDSLQKAMGIMGRSIDIDRIYIWANRVSGGLLHYVCEYEWFGAGARSVEYSASEFDFSYADSIPEWEGKLRKGECVNGPLPDLSPRERERLAPYGIKSILVIPIFLKNVFWGFVSFDDCHSERRFSEDEVNILRSGSLMIAAALSRDRMEQEREKEKIAD
jgi:PAS domain-containing protein